MTTETDIEQPYLPPPVPEMEDVTVAIGRDNKTENRVYRTISGQHVKIKTWLVPTEIPGRMSFEMTGALCDESGSAADSGICHARHVVASFADPRAPSVEEQLEEARRHYVKEVERVLRIRHSPIPVGVGVKPA